MASAPSWITENIYVWCPEGQALVNIMISKLLLHVKFCTRLCRYGITNLLHEIFIKRCCQTNCLWKNCCCAGSCNTVQSLIPPVVRSNSKAFNCWCVIKCLIYLLLKCHLSNQLFRAFAKLFKTFLIVY